MPGGQVTDNADLALRYDCVQALDVQLQCIGQRLPTASLCDFDTSHFPPGPRVQSFTTPEASRNSHHSPRTTGM